MDGNPVRLPYLRGGEPGQGCVLRDTETRRQTGPGHSSPEGDIALFRDERFIARSADRHERSVVRDDRADRRTQEHVDHRRLLVNEPDHGFPAGRHRRVEENRALPGAEEPLDGLGRL